MIPNYLDLYVKGHVLENFDIVLPAKRPLDSGQNPLDHG